MIAAQWDWKKSCNALRNTAHMGAHGFW